MSLSVKRPVTGKFFLLILCLASALASASAQSSNRVAIPKDKITLSELFREIEKQTGSVVIVNTVRNDGERIISLSPKEGSVSGILDQALSGTGQGYQFNGRYIVIVPDGKPAAVKSSPASGVVSYAPQPTQAEFERDIRDYTDRNLSCVNADRAMTVRYDTIRTQRTHDGVFKYPSQTVIPNTTGRAVRSPFSQQTPPLIAIKTNLVWWAAGGTLNLAAEIGLGKKTSLEILGGNNRWNLRGNEDSNKKLVHWMIKPEFRWWLCERFNGHFFGIHAFYGKYNISQWDFPLLFEKEYRYQGDTWGGGISYGYHLAFGKRWGAEFTAGIGVASLDYVKKDCEKCGNEIGRFNKTYFGPTNLGIKLVFIIK